MRETPSFKYMSPNLSTTYDSITQGTRHIINFIGRNYYNLYAKMSLPPQAKGAQERSNCTIASQQK